MNVNISSKKIVPPPLPSVRKPKPGMNGTAVFWGSAALLLLLVLVFWIFSARHTDQRLRDECEARIAERVPVAVAERIVPEEVARELNFSWPLKKPERNLAEAETVAAQAVRAAVEQRYPRMQTIAELNRQAQERFGVLRIGQQVRFNVRSGPNTYTAVEGPLMAIGRERIQVGQRTIARDDLLPQDLVRLDTDLSWRKIDEFVREELALLDEERELYFVEVEDRVKAESLRGQGYAWSEEEDTWLPQDEVFQAELRQRLQQLKDEIAAEEYTAAGYFADNGRWLRNTLLNRIRAAVARIWRKMW